MKKIKVSILALSVLVGGAVFASAANATTYTTYHVSATETNPTASFWDVYGAPTTPSGFPEVGSSVSASTDGSGKIVGAGMVYIDFNTNFIPFSAFTADVSGKIGNKGSATTVSVTVKGTGYTASGDGTGQPASYSVKFTGKPGPNPNTNSSQKVIIVGTGSVSIKGTTPLGAKSATIKSLPMVINSSSLSFVNIEADVLQTLKSITSGKQQLFGNSFTGTGTVNTKGYTANVKGVGAEKGNTLTVTGSMGLYTNTIQVGTSSVVVPFTAPTSATITKGKIQGQSVSGLASRVTAYLID